MATNKCSTASASAIGGPTVSLAAAVAHLEVVSNGVSVNPHDFAWGAPSILQQQALYSQFMQLCIMCSALPQVGYATLCPTLQPGRAGMLPGFMTPFAGYSSPAVSPCPAQSPSPSPCPPAVAPQQPCSQQAVKANSARPEGKAFKSGPPSKKAGSKAKSNKATVAFNSSAPQASLAAGIVKAEAEMDLDDICKLLGDDSFLEHLQDDVLSEGSNGSSSTMDGRLPKTSSHGSLCASGSGINNNDFASAFDLDMDDVPAEAASPTVGGTAIAGRAPAPAPPSKADSGDLNNMVAAPAVTASVTAATSSPTKPIRSARTAAREAAAAVKMEHGSNTGMLPAAASPSKISLKVKGGVQKASGSGSKATKAATAAAVAAAGTCAVGTAAMQAGAGAAVPGEECPLSGAELSRLLGEDDNRIPDGWDLDLDFENPFSCSITAF